jgi:23S rRNA pseudouridine1911/1915/1917 synthase
MCGLMSSSASESRTAKVPPALVGQRLDKVALDLVGAGYSRSRIQAWIQAGYLQVNGEPSLLPSQLVENGQELLLAIPEVEIPTIQSGLAPTVLHQDEGLLVLSKPAGLVMHGNGVGDTRPSVASWLHHHFGPDLPTCQGPERPGIVHRLDRDTSGICLVALQEKVFIDLMEQFSERVVKKEYRALVYGVPRFHSDWIDKRLSPDSKRPDKVRITNSNKKGTRDALTYWEVIELFPKGAMLRIQPKTGRKHQIRVHLASINLPLMGDSLYRAKNFGEGMLGPGCPSVNRTLLHAFAIEFENPSSGDFMKFTVDPPEDFQRVVDFLSA